jgi:hypothetical protein
MAGARPHHTLKVREDRTEQPGPLKVDREKGIIHGVKVLGWLSDNKREYTREAAQRAVREGKYSDVKVRIDHHSDPSVKAEPLFGKIRNPRVEHDGIFADLHFLTTHAMAAKVCEDVERGLGMFGLSHDADAGTWEMRAGVQVVTSIAEVHFVDLVGDGATVSNLWESRNVKTTLKQIIESAAKLKADRKKKLLEMGDSYGASPMEMEAAGGGETDARKMLGQAIAALVQSDSEDDHELAQKVMKLLKPETAGGGGVGTSEVMEDDEMGEEDEDKAKEKGGKSAGESKKRKPGGLQEAKARSLMALAGLKDDAALLESLVGADEAKALKLLEWAKKQQGQAGGSVREDQQPRTGGNPVREGAGNGHGGNGSGIPKFEGESAQKNRLAFLRGR